MKRITAEQIQALEKIGASTSEVVIGIDEVGVGCWAGPMTVAGVAVPRGWSHPEVKDSKALSKGKRKKAEAIVKESALSWFITSATNSEIDVEGVQHARARLTEEVALKMLQYFPGALLVQDGDLPVVIGGAPQNMVWLAKADVLVPAVSAASVLAKVCRDEFMLLQSKNYPGYGFETNMGYGTAKHIEGLLAKGVCQLHRLSYKPVKQHLVR